MQPKLLKTARFIVGSSPASVECVALDGEVNWTLGLLPGLHSLSSMLLFTDPTDTISLVGDVVAMRPDGARLVPQKAQPVLETGANPDFRPTNYSEAEIRLRKLMKDVERQSTALEKRQKSFENASTQMKKPKEKSPVIEEEKPAVKPVIEEKPAVKPVIEEKPSK